jgi:peptidoglycan hydrolase-like protein with peptidoglycan-binding domain
LAHRARHAVSRKVKQVRGQREIDPARATEIQTALIHQNYLSGAPSGQWDAQTEAAMQKYQADHGWQTKFTPDSRALIKLGLGPSATAPAANNAPEKAALPAASEAGTLASIHAVSQ